LKGILGKENVFLYDAFYTKIDPKLLDARYKYGMVLIGTDYLHDQKLKNHNNHNDNGEENILTKISYATEVISPILLPMISALGDLEIEEGEKFYEENKRNEVNPKNQSRPRQEGEHRKWGPIVIKYFFLFFDRVFL
jgi:hypothetical protein